MPFSSLKSAVVIADGADMCADSREGQIYARF